MSKGRPRRGEPGPDVLVSGDTGEYHPQGGARTGPDVYRESGDLDAREFGVPQADLPGGVLHVVNPETHPARTAPRPERPADYHKYHGVPSDDGQYETPPDETTLGPVPRPEPVPDVHDPVPVYIVEGSGKGRVIRASTHDSILVSSSADPVRICNQDAERVEIRLLNEDAANNVRIGSRTELAEGRGSMLPAITNTYLPLLVQTELFAIPAVAGTTARVSVIITTEVPASVTGRLSALMIYAGGGGGGTVTSVTAADASVVISGVPTVTPAVATGTLDVIATQHPPAAPVPMNAKKITGLANGTAATDAAAFGQVVQSVAATDTSIVVAGTATAPTIATGTLDVIAADHPPAADWSNNNHKITSLANGSGAQDAAAFGQVPVADATAAHIGPDGTQVAGANAKWADSGHVHPRGGDWTPADYGVLGATADWESGGSASGALTAGTVYLVRYNVRYAHTITNIVFRVSSGSSGASTGSFVGVYSSAGTLLSGSADTGAIAAGVRSVALTTPQAVTAGTFVWIAILVNFATTQPSLSSVAANSAGMLNWNLSAANLRCAVNGTGVTALPSPSITPGSNATAGALPIFFAVT